MSEYRTTPPPTSKMPPGIPYIIGNEAAERFSFYGMKAILTVFMTQHLLDATGQADRLNDEQAKTVLHLFTAAAYFFPLVGAIISDVLWGKYRTILLISLMYCVGHGLLALMDVGPATGLWGMKPLFFAGLVCIAIGAGGIKPCVSAHVGDQFGQKNKHLLTQVFNWFYFSINLGAAVSTFLTPLFLAGIPIKTDPTTGLVLERFGGPWLAFGVPGVLMALATFVFWLGRNKFVHVPPSGWRKFREETFSPDGIRALVNLSPLFLLFVPMFWAIFDQTGGAWVLQAQSLDRDFLGVTWLESQVQVVNPVLILTLIPVFTYVVYPLMGKFFNPTPLRKIGIGLVLTAGAFAISALIETAITKDGPRVAQELWAALVQAHPTEVAGLTPESLGSVVQKARDIGWTQAQLDPFLSQMPSIGWQFLAYLVLTSAEVLVSIVCLEFAYTQSPPRMKSFIMAVYLLGVSLGNLFVAGVNFMMELLKDGEGKTPLEGATYYWFFAGLMGITTVAYIVFAQFYKGRTYLQSESRDPHTEAKAEGPDAR